MELLEEVKRYCRIDFDDDDGMIKNILIPSAQAYVTSATGITDYETDPRVRLLICVLVKDWYDNRYYTCDKNRQSAQYTIRSIVYQLSLEGSGL
jgi:uncharacterized phage protein (predicted DNA packaging)